jgi:ribosomal protein S18 acetylase RimI-like enzyme
MSDVLICPVDLADVGELLTLQRAAYLTEAQLYNDPMLPALTQTYDQLRDELARSIALKALVDHRIVGAVRAYARNRVLHIGRLIVAPDMQGRGVGTALLEALEKHAAGTVDRYTLFTGHLSTANIRLYQRLGYTEVRREALQAHVVLVHLDKPAS